MKRKTTLVSEQTTEHLEKETRFLRMGITHFTAASAFILFTLFKIFPFMYNLALLPLSYTILREWVTWPSLYFSLLYGVMVGFSGCWMVCKRRRMQDAQAELQRRQQADTTAQE